MEYNRRTDELVDAALAESFPASDPPFFMAAAVVGAPPANTSHRALGPRRGSGKSSA